MPSLQRVTASAEDVALFGDLLAELEVPKDEAVERLSRLTAQEREVLLSRQAGKTQQQAGQELHPPVSRRRARQIEASARHRLRWVYVPDPRWTGCMFSAPVRFWLRMNDVRSLHGLSLYTEEEVRNLDRFGGIGKRRLSEMRAALAQAGKTFRDPVIARLVQYGFSKDTAHKLSKIMKGDAPEEVSTFTEAALHCLGFESSIDEIKSVLAQRGHQLSAAAAPWWIDLFDGWVDWPDICVLSDNGINSLDELAAKTESELEAPPFLFGGAQVRTWSSGVLANKGIYRNYKYYLERLSMAVPYHSWVRFPVETIQSIRATEPVFRFPAQPTGIQLQAVEYIKQLLQAVQDDLCSGNYFGVTGLIRHRTVPEELLPVWGELKSCIDEILCIEDLRIEDDGHQVQVYLV